VDNEIPFIGYAAAEQAHLLVQGSYKFGIGAAR
jgi:hypothetical protein